MACGCPVICSARGSLGEVIGNAAAIIDPSSIESIAAQLKTFAIEPAIHDQFRSAGLLQAKKFDWNRSAAEVMKVYKRAAGEKGEA